MGDHAKNESEIKVNEVLNTLMDAANVLNDRMNALEKAFETLLANAEEKGLNLHGGDGEWY